MKEGGTSLHKTIREINFVLKHGGILQIYKEMPISIIILLLCQAACFVHDNETRFT